MANTNAPFGLKPIGKLGSGYNSTGTTEYDILTGTTGTIYTGDPVKWLAQRHCRCCCWRSFTRSLSRLSLY
jgi:hypothetical protein